MRKHPDLAVILFLALYPFIFFFPVTLGQAVWFTRDLSRVYHPFAVELGRALDAGRLPLWTPALQAGFPLLAEGQIAAFYPFQLLLVKIFPAHFAVSYEMLLHLSLAAVGMYLCARAFGIGAAGALVAGFVFSFNGFMIQKLYHAPILFTAAWLPWLIFFFTRFQRSHQTPDRRAGIWFILTVGAMAMQWLAGSAQIALLNSLTFAFVGFFGGLFTLRVPYSAHRFEMLVRAVLWTALPLMLGALLAAIQLVPTAELLGYSTRARGLGENLLTLYSYSGESLAQFLSPFSQGEPSDDNVELWGYAGLAALFLAATCLRFRRDVRTIFFFGLALVTLSLTLGAVNPLFQIVSRMPLFNLFRVPARYVFPFDFAVAFGAAFSLHQLVQRNANTRPNLTRLLGILGALGAVGVIGLAYTQSLEFWLVLWRWLPWAIGSLAIALIALGWTRRIAGDVLAAAIIALVIFDMSAYAAPFLSTTVAQLTPPVTVVQTPRSLASLGTPRVPERILTDETIWPSVPALRASFYPNFGMLYGLEMGHAYTPLWFDANENYFFNLTPAMLDLLNVRYFAIPLEPRFTDRRPTPSDAFSLDVVNNEINIPPTSIETIEVDSFTEETGSLAQGSPVAELDVKFDDGTYQIFPLRAGIESADWDYARENSTANVPPQSKVAHSLNGFWRSFGRTFEGKVYRSQFPLSLARRVVGLNLRALIPPAHLTVEQITLLDDKGKAISLATLTGKNNLALRYLSDTAAIWENQDFLPRAFIVHHAEVMNNDQVFQALRGGDFRPAQTVLLSEGQPLAASLDSGAPDRVEVTRHEPERVTITASTDRAGYLVLADTFYPGWNAFIDGRPAPIYRADYVFRAVPLEAGEHSVIFEYRPMSLLLGALISAVGLLITIGITLGIQRGKL